MPNDNPTQTVQKILSSWSRTLELDQLSGEFIVTESDLSRLAGILSQYFEKTLTTPLLNYSNTHILNTTP